MRPQTVPCAASDDRRCIGAGARRAAPRPRSDARAPEAFANGFVVRPQLHRSLKRRPRVILLAELEITPSHSDLVLVRVGRGQAGSDKHCRSFAGSLEVVEAPRHLAPQDRHIRRLLAQEAPRSAERLLERRKRGLVVAPLEQGRPEAVRGVDVVGISVQRGPERSGRQLVPAGAKPAPPQTVVEALPRRLTPERGLERDGSAAVIAEEILGPSEQRSRLIVLRIEERRLGEAVAGLLVLPFLEKRAAPSEARLRLHALAEALEHAGRRN